MGKEIIIITSQLGNGGAERVMTELMTEWVHMGIMVSVVQIDPGLSGSDYRFSQDVRIIDMKPHSGVFRHFKRVSELVSILRDHKDAVVVSFVKRAIYHCGIASLFLKNKLVLSERNDPKHTPITKLRRIVRNQSFRLADACVFQTEAAKQYFPKSVQKKGTIIPNPVNPELPKPYDGERRKTVIAAARLDKQKNLPMLIRAFKKFHNDFPDYNLEIYGRGELEDELFTLIKANNLESCAFLMGFSTDIYNKMRDCAMYVSSSDYEGISNSMLEALGMGVPTICTDCPGGAHDMIIDGGNGLLVPIGDVDALYLAMARIAGDPDLSLHLSKNASTIREKLTVESIATEWLRVLT